MGADGAIHIEDEDYEKRDPWTTATILAASLHNLPFDLIFCGRETIDDQDGLVGSYIAEILNIPHVTRVVKVELDPYGKRLLLQRSIGLLFFKYSHLAGSLGSNSYPHCPG